MKIRNLFLLIIVLALPLLLAACGGDKVDNAEKYMKAIADRDFDEAEKYVCDDQKDKLVGDREDVSEGLSFKDISCEEDGDNVKCDFKVAIEGIDEEQASSVTFKMDGDKVCGEAE